MKRKASKSPEHFRTYDMTRGMEYVPQTAPGKTRLEMTVRGPFRPGKTAQDYMAAASRPRVAAWQSRLAKARA